MKKIALLFLFILIGQHIAYSQTAFYDAITLRACIDSSTGRFKTDSLSKLFVGSILYAYCIQKKKGADSTKYATVKELYTNNASKDYNPFIQKYFPTTGSGESQNLTNYAAKFASSIGGLDVTNIADGFAKFIVKRTKEELNIYFFTRFKEVLDDSDYRDIKTIFPNTHDLLGSIGIEIYNYERYIQNLREAFKSDMNQLPKNLPNIIDNHPEIFDRYPEVAATIKSGFYIANSLRDGIHLGDVLADYPLDYLDAINNMNYKASIQTLQLISASLRDTATNDTANYWVTAKQLRKLAGDRVTFKIFLGLVYQQAKTKNVEFENNFKLVEDVLNKVASNYDGGYNVYESYKNYIVTFSEKAASLEKMMKEYKKSDNDSTNVELYAKYFRTSVDMMEYCTKISELPYIKNTVVGNLHKDLHPYFDISYAAADLVTNVNRKNYSAAVNKAVHIYEFVKDQANKKKTTGNEADISPKLAEIRSAIDHVLTTPNLAENDKKELTDLKSKLEPAKANAADLIAVNKDLLKKIKELKVDTSVIAANIRALNHMLNLSITDETIEKLNNTLTKLVMYGGFISSVATAETSDQVREAIEAFALPSGSARIKRESSFNVAANAYCGLFIGNETIDGLEQTFEGGFNSYGLTAPIGISVSWGDRLLPWPLSYIAKVKGCSSSWFISLVDLGAVAAFRFADDKTAQVPSIQLKDIFSPGLFWSVGIPKSPISFNMGAQVGPNLRKVNVTGTNDYSDKMYVRYSVSVCVDIPVINLYTRSKKI